MESKAASIDEPMTLTQEDLPTLYQAANQNSVEAQRRFLRRSGVGLIMLVLAAGAGSLIGSQVSVLGTYADPMGIAAAAAFVIAMLLRISLLTDRPERIWYGGRALAESSKTLAWRYAVGGAPFQIDQDPGEVDLAFTKRMEDILTDVDAASLAPPSGQVGQITQKMRELRARSLDERKEAYRVGRIEDQEQWYSRKSKRNKERSEQWNLALISLETIGVLGAILTAAGVVQIDLLGLTGAVVAAGASWLQAKQHSNLAEAYSVAAHELSAIHDRILLQKTEENWARFVSESEDAISREHTLWRASRTMK
jgi:SMODS and SLOG-associating 2TM effector domain 3/SMODS and SLOG-associating 2TM effector domain 1